MKDLRGRVVLVTGAASGIGRETAFAFARRRARLIVCDIDGEGLGETARALGEAVLMTEVVDVSQRTAMTAFADRVHSQVEAVDVLVNNAGVGVQGGIRDTSEDDFEWVLGVNLWGVIHGCRLFVPRMIERGGDGHVVNLSSLAGICASPGMLAYATSKFAVFGLSESLRAGLRRHRIGVSTICPGVVNTNIIRRTRFKGAALPGFARDTVDAFYRRRDYGPERVAAAIVAAVRHDRGVVPVTPESWAVYWLKRLAPGAAVGMLSRFERRMLVDAGARS